MKPKNLILTGFILCLITSFSLEVAANKLQEKSLDKQEKKSLIRKDLLQRERMQIKPPRRNIFSPRMSSVAEVDPGIDRSDQTLPGLNAQPGETSEQGNSDIILDLKYIGYVISDRRIVGLIDFQGEVLAVEEGDLILAGVEVKKITLEEIEITSPDSKQGKYPLEEE